MAVGRSSDINAASIPGSKFAGINNDIINKPADRKTPEPVKEAPPKKEAVEEPVKIKADPVKESKGKVGRPAKGGVRTSIVLDDDLVDIVEIASLSKQFKGNRSAYINSLIRKDAEENKAEYDRRAKLY